MNHNRKPCFRTKQGLFYLFDVMGMFGAVGTREGFFPSHSSYVAYLRHARRCVCRVPANELAGYPSGAFVAARSAGTRHTGATFVSPCGTAP